MARETTRLQLSAPVHPKLKKWLSWKSMAVPQGFGFPTKETACFTAPKTGGRWLALRKHCRVTLTSKHFHVKTKFLPGF